MPPNLLHFDPRVLAWTNLRNAAMKRLADEHPTLAPHVRLFMAGEHSKGGRPKPATWKALTEQRAADTAALQEALRSTGTLATWAQIRGLGYEAAIAALSPGLEVAEHRAPGPSGRSVPLQIIRPAGAAQLIPLVYYIHGGGMATLSSRDGIFQMFARLIARQGVAVCLVEMRNCLDPTETEPEVAPFPAGLEDCYAGLRWVATNQAQLGVSNVAVAGESGGANLALAVALKAKAQAELELLGDGVFALCPFIAGEWTKEVNRGILGSSHIENGPAVFSAALMYGQEAFDRGDPLAWPGFATAADLCGLPRVVVSVNEFDIFRDEGINLYRRLLESGVAVQCRTVMGTAHANDLHWYMVPDIALATARAIADFAANGRLLPARMAMPAPLPMPPAGLERLSKF